MRKTRSLGHRVLALFLCCVMVYGLIPTEAVALEPICGIEEHVHDESCHAVYGENVLKCRAGEYLHKHTDACYDSGGNLICHYADFYLHKHSAEQGCYDAGGNLVCTLPEYDESVHEDVYYTGADVTCVYAPRFGHVHDESCYETRKTLTCGLEQDENAHRHDESCYDLILTCGFDDGDADAGGSETESGTGTGGAGDAGIPGGSDGTSEGESGDAGDVAVPEGDAGNGEGESPSQEGVLENPEDSTGGALAEPEGQDGDYAPLQHVHDESCYTKTLTCGLEETGHVHDDSCYETVRELTCGKIQDDGDADSVSGNVCRHWQYELHTHDESCFDKDGNVMCGKWELRRHTHDSHCFEREILSYDNPELVCGKDEHKHGLSCYFKEKTEELEAFLSGYEELKNAVGSGEYDLSSDEGKKAVADAAWAVKQIGLTLDKDVLKLDSVKEMMAYLDSLIPDGYNPEGGVVLDDVYAVMYDVRISDIAVSDLAGGHVEIFLQTWTDEGRIRAFDGTELPVTDYQNTDWHDCTSRGSNGKRTGYAFIAEFDVKGYVKNMPSFCMPVGRDAYTNVGRVHVRYVGSDGLTVHCESRAVTFSVANGSVLNKYVWNGELSSLTDFSAADFGISVTGCSIVPVVDMRYISQRLSGGIPVDINVENAYPPNLEGQAVISGYPVTVSSPGVSELPEIYFPGDDIYYVNVSMSVPDGSYGIADDEYYRFVVECRGGVIKSAVYYQKRPSGHNVTNEDGKPVTFSKDAGCRFIVRPSPDVMYDFSSAVKAQAREIMSTMTRKEKLGQMVMADANAGDVRTMVETYGIGGLLLFQAHCTYDWNGDGKEVGERVAGWQSYAGKVPLMISVDEEGGEVNRVSHPNTVDRNGNRLRSEPFKADSKIYAQNNLFVDVQLNAVEKALFLKKFGINVNYAPALDVADTGYMGFLPDGSTDGMHRGRAFSGDALMVSEYAWYALSGQRSGGIGSVVKHFPGYTNTSDNTHDGESSIVSTEFEVEHKDLLPFYAAMADGAGMVMVTHNSFSWLDPGVCSSMSPAAYALARRMGFKGVMITDDLNMNAVNVPVGEKGLAALKAGADVAMVADILDVAGVVNASESDLSDSRVDESVLRILCYKIENGIIDGGSGGDPPVSDGEAEYIDSEGLFGGTGSFEVMWEKAMLFGGTVRLLQDCVVESAQSVSNRDIVLDLDGHELYFTGTGTGFKISNSAEHPFVIKDSSGAVSVDYTELTDFVKQNPKTTATDGMLSGLWDIDYVNRTARWQSVDFDSCKPVEVSLDLSRSGGIRMQNGVALLSSANGSSVKFESGYITSDTTSTSPSRAVFAEDGKSMSFDVTGGWIFGYHSTNSVVSMGQDSEVVFSGGGVVGSNTPHNAIHVWGYDSSVTLKNAHVSANIALEGAVRLGWENAKLTMERCNVASNWGSGVVIDKGGLESMYRCVLAFNRSPDNGGGLVVMDTAWYANVGGSLFAYNSAKENGGAMYIAKGGSIEGYENGTYPVKILNNCADYGGGVCVDRYDVDGGITKFEQVYFDGNEASTAGSIAVRGHGYLTSFSDILVENGKAGDFPGIRLDIMMESSTDNNIRFNNLTVRNCSLYEPADDKYTMNLRNQGTYTELSGMVELDEAVTMKPFAENTLYILRNDFNTASRIPVQAGFTVPLTSPVKLAGVPVGSSFDLATAVKCFVPDAAHKVWYDVAQNAIMYGDINYSQGSSSTGEGVQIEYFANIELVDESASGGVHQLQTIDDSNAAVEKAGGSVLRGMKSNKDADGVGGYLPVNARIRPSDGWASAWPIKQVFLMDNGDDTFSVATHVRLTELYRPRYALVGDGFRLNLGDKATNRFLYTSDGFTTSEVWVKDDRSMFGELSDVDAYITKSNFDRVVPYSESLYLTSDVAVYEADPENAILVSDTSLVRFVADSDISTKPIHSVFYDYNITDGTVRTETVMHDGKTFQEQVVNTSRKGINSVVNYAGNVTGLFGFGNGNHGSGLTAAAITSKDQWLVSSSNQVFVDGISNQVNQVFVDAEGTTNQINKVNLVTDASVRPFIGLTFGLVKGLDASGDIIWSNGVHAPKLYNESGSGSTVGRKLYADSTLLFEQNGNAFTLQGVTSSGDGPELSRDLTTFIRPGTHTDMYTNNFWPMDAVDDYVGKDPLEGGDVKYWYQQLKDETFEKVWSDYPPSDDAVAHNAFFGMHFEVEFDLSDDYVGPMLYYFFGDDDLWVFLDGKLILDIGGVHISAGQYVDLRDYLPPVDAEDAIGGYTTHKLTVYYNERGSSGSTCWMRFRLPTPLRVTTDTPDDVVTHGNLSIEKQVDGHDGSDVTFPVKLVLRNGDGFFAQELSGEFDYVNSDGSVSGKVKSGDVLNLTPGDAITVRQLPVGTVASVAEDLSGFEHPEFWTLVDDESTVKLAVRFGDDNHLVLKNRYNDKSELRITKRVVDGDNNQMDCNESFSFVGTFRVDGMPLSEPLTGFVCPVGVDPDASAVGTTIQIRSGDSFSVPANSTVYIKSAPANLEYDIQELPGEAARLGYALVGNPETPSGTISVGNVQEAVFVNALIQDMPELPSAGGIGLRGFMISGSALLCLVFLELRSRKRRTGTAG